MEPTFCKNFNLCLTCRIFSKRSINFSFVASDNVLICFSWRYHCVEQLNEALQDSEVIFFFSPLFRIKERNQSREYEDKIPFNKVVYLTHGPILISIDYCSVYQPMKSRGSLQGFVIVGLIVILGESHMFTSIIQNQYRCQFSGWSQEGPRIHKGRFHEEKQQMWFSCELKNDVCSDVNAYAISFKASFASTQTSQHQPLTLFALKLSEASPSIISTPQQRKGAAAKFSHPTEETQFGCSNQ